MTMGKVARGVTGVMLLIASTSFMNTAWYLHLKFDKWSYVQAIFVSWAIALPEYSLQVPANRLAHQEHGGPFTAPQLKVIAEICSLVTFAVFSAVVLKERLRWVDLGAFVLIVAGVLLSLLTKKTASSTPSAPLPPLPGPSPTAEGPAGAALNGGRRRMLELLQAGRAGAEATVTIDISKCSGGAMGAMHVPVTSGAGDSEQAGVDGVQDRVAGDADSGAGVQSPPPPADPDATPGQTPPRD